jgi:hypothetical protein
MRKWNTKVQLAGRKSAENEVIIGALGALIYAATSVGLFRLPIFMAEVKSAPGNSEATEKVRFTKEVQTLKKIEEAVPLFVYN